MIDIFKDSKQEDLLNEWANSGGVGGIQAPPRFGKTRLGLKACEKHSKRFTTRTKIAIIVPNATIQLQWSNYFDAHFNPAYRKQITIYTKNSVIVSNLKEIVSLLIIDEGHLYVTDKGKAILKQEHIASRFVLVLSGSYTKELEEYYPILASLSEEEARNNNWISDYLEYNIGVDFTPSEAAKYEERTNYIKESLDIVKGSKKLLGEFGTQFTSDYDVLQSCYTGKRVYGKQLSAESINTLVAEVNGWRRNLDLSVDYYKEINRCFSPNNLFERARIFNDVVRKRNELINFCESKLQMGLEIVKMFENKKIISFAQSTKFADEFADRINAHYQDEVAIAYHTMLESCPMMNPDTGRPHVYASGPRKGQTKLFGLTSQKKAALEGVETGLYRVLSTVNSFNVGLDIPDLAVGIITSGDCNAVTNFQRKSRPLTVDPDDPYKLAYVFNIYIKNFQNDQDQTVYSRDLAKLRERQDNDDVLWISDLSEVHLTLF